MLAYTTLTGNSLLVHKDCSSELRSLFFTYFKVKSSAVPQPRIACVFLSWKEEGEQGKKQASTEMRVRQQNMSTCIFVLTSFFQGLILVAHRITASFLWSE